MATDAAFSSTQRSAVYDLHFTLVDKSLSQIAIFYRDVMSQPVKLSDFLVLDARLAGEATGGSIAGQVEFWARLGRSVELLLQGRQALKLCQNAAAQPLSSCLKSVDSAEGRKRLGA